MGKTDKYAISEAFKILQDQICESLEKADGKGKFVEDLWDRTGGGGGRTRVIANGNVIEKGGVNFSAVFGQTPAKIIEALNLEPSDFYATGVSIVLHPANPHIPIIHMNIRYFEMSNGTWWFGGGIDLTPHYVNTVDAHFFHSQLKKVCDQHKPDYYERFKKWADDYFYLKHRNETRGIGGIFFDRLAEKEGLSLEEQLRFVLDVGEVFAPTYIDLINRHRNKNFTHEEKEWQMVRRGRYVEFNLVYDKGTKFGLDTDGRTESILMSLPPQANWLYNHTPPSGSAEQQTLSYLKKGIDWITLSP